MTAGGVNGPPVLNGAEFTQPAKTMGQLITDVVAGCGWIDQMANVPKRTLKQLREYVMNTLGFPTPQTKSEIRTLTTVREDIIRRLGFYYSATRAPGMDALINNFINEAQANVFRRLELDLGDEAFPARLVADGDELSLDYVPVFNLALALAKAHYGQQDSKAYFEIGEKYFADRLREKPPNIENIVRQALIDAQEEIVRRYESANLFYNLGAFFEDDDETTVDFRPVQALATGIVKAQRDQKDAKLYLDMVEKWFSDLNKRIPANAISIIRANLTSAQEELYFKYPVVRNERWFSVPLVAGESIYDVPQTSGLYADLRQIRSAWIKVGTRWTPLVYGIDPACYTGSVTGPPTRYKFGRYVEVWPTPAAADTLYLYGHLGLTEFTSDDHVATVDAQPLYLFAVALTKAAFNMPDANVYFKRQERMVQSLIAHSHGNERYIPRPMGDCVPPPMPQANWR